MPSGGIISAARSDKMLVIRQVSNGFTLTDEYGQTTQIAKDLNEAQVLVGTYFGE